MTTFTSKDELLRIEDMIRRGRSNTDIVLHMNAVYSDDFLNSFRDYLKAKDKLAKEEGIKNADLMQEVDRRTRAQMKKEFEERLLREATNVAALYSLSEPAMKFTALQAKGLVDYNIRADGVYIGAGCFAQCIKWDDLDQFIRELQLARDKAREMLKRGI